MIKKIIGGGERGREGNLIVYEKKWKLIK